jgi:hypothetical protein
MSLCVSAGQSQTAAMIGSVIENGFVHRPSMKKARWRFG